MTSDLATPHTAEPAIVDDAPVPFVDLSIQNHPLADQVAATMRALVTAGDFVLGAAVTEFEADYARYCGVEHCVGVANGTDAIELALRAAGVGAGDEVIIPANTFVATAEAVVRAGARPVLADCGNDYLIDPASAALLVTRHTKAVIAVHLYGQVAAVDELQAAVGPDVVLIEDAAQAQGARHHGRPAGSFGLAAGTSFYPGKNLGAFGDAGAVLTDSDDVAQQVQALRNHGGVRRYEHAVVGTNSRLDTIQAAVLSLKLHQLDEWNAQRRAAADRYSTLLGEIEGIDLPFAAAGNEHVWHLYVVRVRDREQVQSALGAAGIGTGIHYPLPIHRLPAFAWLDVPRGSVPVADSQADGIMSLPMFPGITDAQQDRVADALTTAVKV